VVRKERLELSRLAALEPKSSASTNSATLAMIKKVIYNKNLALFYNKLVFIEKE
jgi:hypothetical protein